MLNVEAMELVAASPASLLRVLTDASNLEVWDSGMVHHDGDVRDGSQVTVSSSDGQHCCTFTVQLAATVQLADEMAMTWSHAGAFGFFRASRTWTLTPADGGTLLLVADQFRGPLAGQLRGHVPLAGSAADLERYLQAVKARAELLQRTLETR